MKPSSSKPKSEYNEPTEAIKKRLCRVVIRDRATILLYSHTHDLGAIRQSPFRCRVSRSSTLMKSVLTSLLEPRNMLCRACTRRSWSFVEVWRGEVHFRGSFCQTRPSCIFRREDEICLVSLRLKEVRDRVSEEDCAL